MIGVPVVPSLLIPIAVLKVAVSVLVVPDLAPGGVNADQLSALSQLGPVAPTLFHVSLVAKAGDENEETRERIIIREIILKVTTPKLQSE